ncbi:MAG: MATE family efflux transporter [Muribaculaceae bacterium]|nr:MATE family efflux transporter [Muribaculaceae bacterium]
MISENRNLDKSILLLAAPAIINNITVPLLGLCDTTIAGHLGSPRYLASISVGTMMLNVFFWLAGFLRMGTTGLTARSVGRGSYMQCREVLMKSLLIAGVISLIVLACQNSLLTLLLRFLAPGSDAAELAGRYFRIGVWWVPAQLTIMAVSGWFIGLQTTVIPMTIAIGTNVINIAASVLFVFGIKRGFDGIAYGTLVANWIGAIAALCWALVRLNEEKKKLATKGGEEEREYDETTKMELKGDRIKWSEFFKVNSALFIRSACIMAVTLTVTSVGSQLGELTLAANAVIMQFFLFFSYFMDGFAFSGEALAGKFSGAGDREMVIKTMKSLCRWGAVMALIFLALYTFGSKTMAQLITDSGEVVDKIEEYRLWIQLLPPVTVSAFIFDGLFVGLTRTRAMMWVTIAGAALFFIILFGPDIPHTNNLLWLSFESYLFVRGAALAVTFFYTVVRKRG